MSAGRGKFATLPSWMTSGSMPSSTGPSTDVAAQSSVPSISTDTNLSNTVVQVPSIATPAITPAVISAPVPRPFIPFQEPVAATASMPLPAQTAASYQNPPRFVPPPRFQSPMYTMGAQMPQPMYNMHAWGNPVQFGQPQFAPSTPHLMPPRIFPAYNPTLQPKPSTSQPQLAMDPNNDVTAWSEHDSEDGRKYWFNKITAASTYEKPFCLKTPEERAIPPCPWKEYATPEGKKYYSDGKESVWVMPEEFRVWKEKVDAAIAKKANSVNSTTATQQSDSKEKSRDGNGVPGDKSGTDSDAPRRTKKQATEPEKVALVFNTKEEARAAFLALLTEKNISSSMRTKEVQDICQDDPRWEALKGGEKKQELAEFQTRKLKEEREQQKLRARKCKDAFLLMLAECVQIDARTRWRDAIELLQKDARYKNVEDPRDREDLFNDFVLELEKKEREDLSRKRDEALKALVAVLERKHTEGRLHRKSTWGEHKAEIINLVVKEPEFRALDETDARRTFNDFIERLETDYRQHRKLKRVELQKCLDGLLLKFKDYLRSLAKDGVIDDSTRWKEIIAEPTVKLNPIYNEIIAVMEGNGNEDLSANSLGLNGDPRDVFLDVQREAADAYKADRTLVKKLVDDRHLEIMPNTTFADFKNSICKVTNMKDVSADSSTPSFVTEEGEVIDDSVSAPTGRATHSQLRQLLLQRPRSLEKVFSSLQEEVIAEKQEEERRARRREERFKNLLSEFFYRSDHVGMTWDEAKPKIEDCNEYYDVAREDRKRLFTVHMDELSRRLEAKKLSMKQSDAVVPDPAPVVASTESVPRLQDDVDHTDSSSSSSDGESERKSKRSKKEKKHKKRKKESDDKHSKHKRRKS